MLAFARLCITSHHTHVQLSLATLTILSLLNMQSIGFFLTNIVCFFGMVNIELKYILPFWTVLHGRKGNTTLAKKNRDSRAHWCTGACTLEHPRACSLVCVAISFFGQGSSNIESSSRSSWGAVAKVRRRLAKRRTFIWGGRVSSLFAKQASKKWAARWLRALHSATLLQKKELEREASLIETSFSNIWHRYSDFAH